MLIAESSQSFHTALYGFIIGANWHGLQNRNLLQNPIQSNLTVLSTKLFDQICL
jgi:hypothetical protein